MPRGYMPSWGQTVMAEDIFKSSIAIWLNGQNLSEKKTENDEVMRYFARFAMDAAVIFDQSRKDRKFPEMVIEGDTRA